MRNICKEINLPSFISGVLNTGHFFRHIEIFPQLPVFGTQVWDVSPNAIPKWLDYLKNFVEEILLIGVSKSTYTGYYFQFVKSPLILSTAIFLLSPKAQSRRDEYTIAVIVSLFWVAHPLDPNPNVRAPLMRTNSLKKTKVAVLSVSRRISREPLAHLSCTPWGSRSPGWQSLHYSTANRQLIRAKNPTSVPSAQLT